MEGAFEVDSAVRGAGARLTASSEVADYYSPRWWLPEVVSFDGEGLRGSTAVCAASSGSLGFSDFVSAAQFFRK